PLPHGMVATNGMVATKTLPAPKGEAPAPQGEARQRRRQRRQGRGMSPAGEPVKVVHIITRLILGGAQENTILTVEGLHRRQGYQTILVSGPALGPEGELVKRIEQNDVKLIIIPQMRRNINLILDFIAFVKLYFLMMRLKPDIVHTHSAKAGILGRFAAYLAGVKIIVHTLHGVSFHPYQNKMVNSLYIAIERFASFVTTKFISVCDAMTEQSLRVKIGNPEKYKTIYSALELDKFTPTVTPEEAKKRLGLEHHKVVGTIARIAPLKGHHYILQIATRIIRESPEVKFLFVGDGSLMDKIRREVQGRGLDKWFMFTGLVPPEQIPLMIQAIDILVHPSLREGLARAIPQSFSLAKPVVSFDIDGARELVINGKTGYLIPPPLSEKQSKDSLDKLTTAINHLLKNEYEAKQMGEQGRTLIIPNFDSNYMVEKIIEIYLDLINK
ncbi:MAG: glycosyltransferase family 4 protein, partial [Planctomycetota bacterium]|nr:glycosyltransferase family 4 protein [Planctomycetota bacterium]MDI6788615.1 glycosyltransferase family 4 protein [Planctomycetota bacterium]